MDANVDLVRMGLPDHQQGAQRRNTAPLYPRARRGVQEGAKGSRGLQEKVRRALEPDDEVAALKTVAVHGDC